MTIAAGEYHACALGRGGEVYCWGAASHGQLGVVLSSSAGYQCIAGDIVFGCATTPVAVANTVFVR